MGPFSSENVLARIKELLQLADEQPPAVVAGAIYVGTLSVATQLWGQDSTQVGAIKQLREDIQASRYTEPTKIARLIMACQGALFTIANDIKAGLIGSVRLEYQGQVLADLVNMAKAAIVDQAKDVAAVLVAAALEGTLKRYAEARGLAVEDEDLTTVVNALKSAGLLSAVKGQLLKGMVPFRNKALHAEWNKIDSADVRSVLGFVEEFLAGEFS